jgi:putative aldouronate transport system substrate-binding protein
MKKKFLLGLVSLMVAASFFGCGKKKDNTDKTGNDSDSTFEAWPEEVTLGWWLIGGTDEYYQHYFQEMKGWQEIQERTNITIDFQVQTNSDNYLPMMTAATYPDIITANHYSMYPGRLNQLYLDGIAVELNQYMDEYMPNFSNIIKNYPTIARDLQVEDGKYIFASTLYDVDNEEDRMANSVYGLAIREDWLDTVGLEIPTNMEEWYQVLKAFKTMDPNGNGVQDEEPICMASSGWKYFLCAYGIGDDPILDENGKVYYGYATDAYKEFLSEMNRWNNEGLFYNWFKKATLVDQEDRTVGNFAGAIKTQAKELDEDDPDSYISKLRQTVPEAKLTAAPWPETADGEALCYSNIASFGTDTTIITSNCKNPEAAAYFIDYLYSEEGSTYLSWGIEGESYEVVDGEKQMLEDMDEDVQFYDTTMKKRYTYADPTTIGFPMFKTFASCILSTKSDSYVEACRTWAQGDTSYRMPYAVMLNDKQTATIDDVENTMKDYIRESRQDFIEGKEPLTNYDNYLEQLKLLGVEDYIAIWQECYDAYTAREIPQ